MSQEFIKRLLSSVILLPIFFFAIVKGYFVFNSLISIFFLILCFEWYKISVKRIYMIPGYVFLLFSFISVYLLRNNDENDYLFLTIVILICILTDIGGYVFGKILKGPKLTKISPNKTYSGMIGSYILPILILFWVFKSNIFNLSNIIFDYKFIFFISTISQIGDLIISYFKRLGKVKNTGKIIPGHGGLLERVDGMIFAIPLAFLIKKLELLTFI